LALSSVPLGIWHGFRGLTELSRGHLAREFPRCAAPSYRVFWWPGDAGAGHWARATRRAAPRDIRHDHGLRDDGWRYGVFHRNEKGEFRLRTRSGRGSATMRRGR